MCSFFSCISDGEGVVRHFLPSDVADIMAHGNPKGYDFNSHTSYLSFIGQKGRAEDKWNRWEYDPTTKTLTLDTLGSTDDREAVQMYLDQYCSTLDIEYIRNLYSRNQGDRNQGDRNQGDRNHGHLNQGNWNQGDRNQGHLNQGNRNKGNWNQGHLNQGDRNQGDRNQGNRNQGFGNQGDGNQGHLNQGNGNKGDGNQGNYCNGYFSTHPTRTLFNVVSTPDEIAQADGVDLWSWYKLNEWVSTDNMTSAEKQANPSHVTTCGFIRIHTPKQAWAKCPAHILAQIQALPHFDPVVFLEISGIDVRKKATARKGKKP